MEKYTGADIVEKATEENNKKFKNLNNVSFKCLDIVADKLPRTDLVMTRDLLMHLSNKNVSRALDNIKKSGSTYLLVSYEKNVEVNDDTFDGGYRPLNLTIEPFNLMRPLEMFMEKQFFTEDFGRCMGLFKIN